MMLDVICAHLRNYFAVAEIHGTFDISGGEINLPQIKEGQYFRIVGSVFNDGVYRYPAKNLTDESFDGEVWAMAIPPALIALADDIKKYTESESAKPSPYVSESFGGYTYTKAKDATGVPADWRKLFGASLNRWRKL